MKDVAGLQEFNLSKDLSVNEANVTENRVQGDRYRFQVTSYKLLYFYMACIFVTKIQEHRLALLNLS